MSNNDYYIEECGTTQSLMHHVSPITEGKCGDSDSEIPIDDDLHHFHTTRNNMAKYNNWICKKLDKFLEIERWDIPPKQSNLLVIYIKRFQNGTELQQNILNSLRFNASAVRIVELTGAVEARVELQMMSPGGLV